MKNSALPKSKAKTAYGLLTEVRTLILAEPKRLRMSHILNTNAIQLYGDDAPVCGTVACIAGWVVMLKGDPTALGSACSQAQQILGLTEHQKDQLFFYWDTTKPEGTAAHAKSEDGWIRRFQNRYASQLKAKRV